MIYLVLTGSVWFLGQIVKCLVDGGADVNRMVGEIRATHLRAAVFFGHPEIVTLLLQKGADVSELQVK